MSFVRYALFAMLALLVQAALPPGAAAKPVLLISVDGLRADDVTDADRKGLNIPTLRGLADGGVSAAGVKGVLPTITYPSHTTMITGVHPAKHGIAGNATFDPMGTNMGGWMWYAQDIRVPTLWDMVKAKGGTVASIGWPSSVGARAIDYNIPEFWRARIPEDEKLLRLASTPDMPDEIARLTGIPFAHVALDHADMDDARMAWIAAIVARHRPRLTTVHLVTLDGARHKYGPDSPEARATLERIDRGLGTLIARARAVEPDLVVAIVSDHGFAPLGKGLNLAAALAADGLVTYGANGKVTDWSAFPWTMGGSAAIMLKDPADNAVAQRVGTILAGLAADPANGIDRILDRQEIARLGGTTEAAFWVSMKSGRSTVAGPGSALLQDVAYKGTHGYSPENPDMAAAFFISGPGIVRKRLGVIDMRDIGPTIGQVLDAQLPRHDGRVIPVMADDR